ncbi:MAG TPA: hypothetical protein PKV72_02610 [Candidatus Peribacteria bacterium]|nr:hypothetical protein [Candidatus Peribacteria bacterium]
MPTPEELVGKYLTLPERKDNADLKIQGRTAHVIAFTNGKLRVIVGAGASEQEHLLDPANVADNVAPSQADSAEATPS